MGLEDRKHGTTPGDQHQPPTAKELIPDRRALSGETEPGGMGLWPSRGWEGCSAGHGDQEMVYTCAATCGH